MHSGAWLYYGSGSRERLVRSVLCKRKPPQQRQQKQTTMLRVAMLVLASSVLLAAVAADESTPPSPSCVVAFNITCAGDRGRGLTCHTCFLAHATALEAAGCASTQAAMEGLCQPGSGPSPAPGPGGGGGSTGKNTWAIENPEPYWKFMQQYLPSQTNVVSDFPKCFTDEDQSDNADGCHCWAKMCIDSPSNTGQTCSGAHISFKERRSRIHSENTQGNTHIQRAAAANSFRKFIHCTHISR